MLKTSFSPATWMRCMCSCLQYHPRSVWILRRLELRMQNGWHSLEGCYWAIWENFVQVERERGVEFDKIITLPPPPTPQWWKLYWHLPVGLQTISRILKVYLLHYTICRTLRVTRQILEIFGTFFSADLRHLWAYFGHFRRI